MAVSASPTGSIVYTYTAADAYFGSGHGRVGADVVRWEGQGWCQVFADWAEAGVVHVSATAPGQITLDLSQMLGLRELADYTLEAGGAPWEHTRAGSILVFPVTAGVPVTLRVPIASIDAKIAIVWPHDDAPVAEAGLANLTAYLTLSGSRMSVPCDFASPVTLWRALNNEPAEPVAPGMRRLADFEGRRVPVWDFNDVDVSAAAIRRTSCTSACAWPVGRIVRMSGRMALMRALSCRSRSIRAARRSSLPAAPPPIWTRVSKSSGRTAGLR